jgi:hypothetical protein
VLLLLRVYCCSSCAADCVIITAAAAAAAGTAAATTAVRTSDSGRECASHKQAIDFVVSNALQVCSADSAEAHVYDTRMLYTHHL